MELHCLPTGSPTTASSCSTDPLYDNCPPFAQRDKAREKEAEIKVVCPVVTRPSKPSSPQSGLVPALAEVQTVVGGGRGLELWPDHSYCSCRGVLGGQAWESDPSPGMNKVRGQQGVKWRAEDGAYLSHSPSQSEEHRSALSFYDNLMDTGLTGSLQEVSDMETSFQEYAYRVPEELILDDAVSIDKSPWSSCEVLLNKGCSSKHDWNPDQDKEQDPELLDSGPCESVQEDLTLHQPSQTDCLWPPLEHPKTPPPVPLADPSASALRSLLTGLQQQIIRQREEYEARIVSLEQRNEELQVEVVHLKTNLSQQRHWYQVVQAKIVESERARAAAELRNAALQKEMEQFFDTFGELNNEVKKTEYIVKSF